MERFRNKYRTRSPRARWWDYARPGAYFITICTKNREHLFGKIINKSMMYNPIGAIVLNEWEKSFMIRSEMFCDGFVLMPDHLHAIIRIVVDAHSRAHLPFGRGQSVTHDHAHQQVSSTGVAYRPPKSISSFIAGFKSAATKQINDLRNTPGLPVWQPKFYDHIIKNEQEYQKIKQYIIDNPANYIDH